MSYVQELEKFSIELPSGIQNSIRLQPETSEISTLIAGENFEQLSNIPVSVDMYGKVISRYGEMTWDLYPYNVGDPHKAKLDFTYLSGTPRLLQEVKATCYIWLRVSGSWRNKGKISVSTLHHRFINLKRATAFLQAQGCHSLSSLCEKDLWQNFEQSLGEANLSAGSISEIFKSLKAIVNASDHLPFVFHLKRFNTKKLSQKLADANKTQRLQTFAIPQRLADLIYGEALALVEEAYQHRDLIAKTAYRLRKNFLEAKAKVDAIIDSNPSKNQLGPLSLPTKKDRDELSKRYRAAISKLQKPYLEVVKPLLKIKGVKQSKKGNAWAEAYMGRLLAACYICVVAFSGMRISESYKLTPNSYATRKVHKQIFHVLLGAHHKLTDGLKKDEWLCSPGAGKAIELACALTKGSRQQLLDAGDAAESAGEKGAADKLRDQAKILWLRQHDRHKLPKPIRSSNIVHHLNHFLDSIDATLSEEDLEDFKLINPDISHLKAPKVGKKWRLAPHQMRRTFAVFGSRHNLMGLAATKQQFKHLYIRMTEYYRKGGSSARAKDARLDNELLKLLDDCRTTHEASELYQFYNSDMKLTGGRGKAIVQERQSAPQIYSNFNVLKELVKKGKLTYHQTGTGGCTNGFRCELEAIANPAPCVECNGSVITAKHGQNWQKKHSSLLTHLKNPALSPGEFSLFIAQVRAAEQVMTDLGMPFKKYEPEVEAMT